jgi:hypothetical protein
MANTNNPKGFKPIDTDDNSWVVRWKVNASETTNIGDVLYLGTDGYATLTRVAGYILGVQVGNIEDGITGVNNTTSSSTDGEDTVLVNINPNLLMTAQITTGAVTDPYTTGSSATAFDIAGTTGVQYINAGASAQDEIKVILPAYEDNGSVSAAGAYQKVLCKFNIAKHFLGTLA